MGRPSYRLTDSEAKDLIRRRAPIHEPTPERRPFESQWLKNLSYLAGKQQYVQDGVRMREPDTAPHRVKYRANFIRASVTRAVEGVMATRVAYKCPPINGSRAARNASFVSEKLFDHLREVTDWDLEQYYGTLWAAVCGSYFYQVVFDAGAGEPERFYQESKERKIVIPSSMLTTSDKQAKDEEGAYRDLPPGECVVRGWNPFQVWWDWNAREKGISQCRHFATATMMPLDMIRELWPEKGKLVKPMKFQGTAMYFQEVIRFITGTYGLLYGQYAETRGVEEAPVITYYEIPTADNGMLGRLIICAGDEVVENRDNPYRRHGYAIPFVKQDWLPMPGRFIGAGLVEEMISSQFQYNKARATIVECQNIFGNPPIFVPEGSKIPTGNFVIEPGTVYPYVPGAGKIETGPVPQIPKEVGQNAEMALKEMSLISSQTDPDMSKMPGQIRGAQGLRFMFEEKNKVLQPVARGLVRVNKDVGKQLLALAKTHYSEQRTIRYVGENNEFRTLDFTAADVNTDLRVVGEPDFFFSSATARMEIIDFVQAGALDPKMNPSDRLAVLKALAFNTADEAISDRVIDEENQARETQEMLLAPSMYPQGYPTNEWDDHAAHIREMERFLKSEDYRKAAPDAKAVAVQHYRMHKLQAQMAMEQQIRAQAAMADAVKGAPGGQGQPSAPKQKVA